MKRSTLLTGVAIALVCLVLIIVVVTQHKKFGAWDVPMTPSTGVFSSGPAKPSLPPAPRTPPAGMKEYRSIPYHFSLFYPEALSVSERDEGGGARTITFQNLKSIEGFQIFIVPYTDAQVSAARFKKDEPSGVRLNATDRTVDSAVASSFYSTNQALGDTREVWFVHDGYLYEITTLKALDSWLDPVISSWKFLIF